MVNGKEQSRNFDSFEAAYGYAFSDVISNKALPLAILGNINGRIIIVSQNEILELGFKECKMNKKMQSTYMKKCRLHKS